MARCDDCKANKVCDHNRFGFENCGNFIPADVVPKSEVEKLQAEKDVLIKNYAECMKDYAMEIFEEIERLCDARLYWNNCSIIQRDDIAKLKKKYIKGD